MSRNEWHGARAKAKKHWPEGWETDWKQQAAMYRTKFEEAKAEELRQRIRADDALSERDELRAEVERLREVLQRIADMPRPESRFAADRILAVQSVARRALGEEVPT